ncbi:MAG: hypothetical protein AAFQ68_17470, partial [Bacteroidota bacterium]
MFSHTQANSRLRNLLFALSSVLLLSVFAFRQDQVEQAQEVAYNFSLTFPGNLVVRAIYDESEPQWKQQLQITYQGKLLHQADQMTSYEFDPSHLSPRLVKAELQYLLLERDDRPSLNKTDVFRIVNQEIDSIFSIPAFPKVGADIDGDGKIEFWGQMEVNELITEEKMGYIPFHV